MEEHEIKQVAKILADWNPLGARAARVRDLDGYRTEAIDIICGMQLRAGKTSIESVIMQVLNGAFGLSLTKENCLAAAAQIRQALEQHGRSKQPS